MLDVREDFEWAAGHVDGAHHVPGNQLPERLGELAQDRPLSSSAGADTAARWPRTT